MSERSADLLPVFLSCASKDGRCPSPEDLSAAQEVDRQAAYFSPRFGLSDLGSYIFPIGRPACVKYISVRTALSLGRYGTALEVLGNRTSRRSREAVCHLLLELERARILWFLEDYKGSLLVLHNLEQRPHLPFEIEGRAKNLRASIAIEYMSLAAVGETSLQSIDTPNLSDVASEMVQLGEEADRQGDFEIGAWARFDAAVAALLGDAGRDTALPLQLLTQIPPNGIPHSMRRLANAMAVCGYSSQAEQLLSDAHRRAMTLYPENLITMKIALDLASLAQRFPSNDLESRSRRIVQSATRSFVKNQREIIHSPVGQRLDRMCRRLFGTGSHDISPLPTVDQLLRALAAIKPDDMELRVARVLLEHEFADVQSCPHGEPYFDYVVTTRGRHGVRLGVQVKSGKTTLKQNDIPGSETLDEYDLQGYVAITVATLGSHAASALKRLSKRNYVVLAYTGTALATWIIYNSAVLSELFPDGI